MRRNHALLVLFILVSFLLGALNYWYPRTYLQNGFRTVLALVVIHLFFKIVLEGIAVERVQDKRTKYSLRKAVSIIYIVSFLAVSLSIWIAQTQTLIVSYGLIGAGIAVALQDFFKNFIGGLIIIT